MTKDEAARAPDPEGSGTPAPRTPAAPGGAPGGDQRPRPQYGEYAPEGWTWQPPTNGPHAGAPTSPGQSAGPAADPAASTAVPAAHPQYGAAPRRADRPWTIALLAFGVIGALYNCLAIIAMPANVVESMKLSASILGTSAPTEFTPGPAVAPAIAIGVAAQIVLWVGALLWSRARMRAGATSWWVPLVAGVVAVAVVMIVGGIILASDPALVEFMRSANISPTP